MIRALIAFLLMAAAMHPLAAAERDGERSVFVINNFRLGSGAELSEGCIIYACRSKTLTSRYSVEAQPVTLR